MALAVIELHHVLLFAPQLERVSSGVCLVATLAAIGAEGATGQS